jgi:hypothetical protein
MRSLVILATALLAVAAAAGQSCPKDKGSGKAEALRASSLHGRLVFHDELRRWLGIKLEQPVCGQAEIELVFSTTDLWRKAKALNGCTITATGKLYYGLTGYYSTEMAIMDPTLRPDPSCKPHAVETDPATVKVPASIKAFHASVTVDYRGKGHVHVEAWEGDDRRKALLEPSQAYVSYSLAGATDAIRFSCRDGFGIKDFTQKPKSTGALSVDVLGQVGTVLQDQNGRNVISFACERQATKRTKRE